MSEGSARTRAVGRRMFLRQMGYAGFALAAGPTVLAACTRDLAVAPPAGTPGPTPVPTDQATDLAQVLVDDVIDFGLTSEDWSGDFGFVRMRLRPALVDGTEAHYVQTDASDAAFASAAGLIHVPKMAPLATPDLSGQAYLFDDGHPDQATVLSSLLGADDYTPAWRVHRVTWNTEPRLLTSVAEIMQAAGDGDLEVEDTSIVVNYGIVAWGDQHMAVDTDLTGYLGGGQLIEPPDLAAGSVMFKLGQCYPSSRYFVLDHSMGGAAEMTQTVHSPKLQDGPTAAGATARTNVFGNGIAGPGPMGAQPSVFDFDPGDPAWSPYWDHFMYFWTDESQAELLTTQDQIHARRDAGDLEEHEGMPEAPLFTVNCPAPIVAPPTYDPADVA